MKRISLIILLAAFAIWVHRIPAVRANNAPPAELNLIDGWHITQDVRQLGEQAGWYKPDFANDWQPIDRLVHLQLLLAPQPYFGRNLRYFNDSPWWYRIEFSTEATPQPATLRFEGVDYFAKVWLNGTLLGEHEGYADPFEFEVTRILRNDRPNVLVVKVWSPWDHEYRDPRYPIWSVVRNLLKGSYEHADTFVQRDVNPIGIWRPVRLVFHDELREVARPVISSMLSADRLQANVKIVWSVFNDGQPQNVRFAVHVRSGNTKKEVVSRSLSFSLAHGANTLETSAIIRSPELWTIWDRGAQPLYEATLELVQSRIAKLSSAVTFGVRTVELHRSADETRFFINGEPVYLRGATYWPDLYLSNVDKARYERDMQAAMRAGINALRVHVHTENPEFYEICDRLGIVLIQDNDLNWVFPTDAGFSSRALRHFSNLIKLLRNHPSIVAWIAMNEVGVRELGPDGLARIKSSEFEDLGSRLVAETYKLDPTRPVIENSMDSGNPNSGDTHDYRGSLIGGNFTYFDIFGSKDKLVTEFGVDAPPAFASLSAIPEVASRLSDVLPRMPELHNYQYHLLKYYIEHYRIQKYSPNAGFFLFMWIDFSPQSFYGIYDYWGVAKSEGIGGGLRALQESNQPIGIFMEHNTKPIALYVVNDTSADLGNCFARWSVSTSTGIIAEDSQPVRIGPDSHRRLRDFEFTIKEGETYKIVLELLSPDGRVLAHNSYLNPFQPQARPRGYPDRMDDELGMRLWWADEKK